MNTIEGGAWRAAKVCTSKRAAPDDKAATALAEAVLEPASDATLPRLYPGVALPATLPAKLNNA